MANVANMYLQILFDLDNLLADMEEPGYKKIGFKIEDEATTTIIKARTDVLQKIPKDLVNTYEMLKKRYRRAIAPVENGFCFGCFQKLPTELSTKSKEVIYCPNCGRILYLRKK
jgi:predicted  nucleic acid-binding Zn-ribbon protein